MERRAGKSNDETLRHFGASIVPEKIYSSILGEGNPVVQATSKLAEKYEVDPVIFMGFLDRINTSLRTLELGGLEDQDSITLDIDFEKLYFNMLQAKADYLYTLEEWNSILSEEKAGDHQGIQEIQDRCEGEKPAEMTPALVAAARNIKMLRRLAAAFL